MGRGDSSGLSFWPWEPYRVAYTLRGLQIMQAPLLGGGTVEDQTGVRNPGLGAALSLPDPKIRGKSCPHPESQCPLL